ncbi:MAG: glycine--tRNA ligase [Candidatus Gracilibacteria bacterium]|nr:glycine--tRNA ligase [Candidatus Gracilibacteria bacterium]
MTNVTMKDIVNLCQSRGFVYPGSEIYGGLANSWDYGPYGSLMKENIKNLWIKEFVQKKDDMMLLDSSILLNPKVWVASGHVGGFSDPLIDDKNTKQRYRADKLLEALIESLGDKASDLQAKYGVNNLIPESWPLEKQTEVMRGEKVVNPDTGEVGDWTDAKKFNLMFRTSQGVTDDSSSTIYMRPETAQGIFVDFPNVLRTSRRKIPFGVAQVGKAFRNEITPGNFIFRTREFEQMEIEYFCEPGTDLELHAKWKQDCMNFLQNTLSLNSDNLRFRDHEADELSHYSNATTDIEYRFPFGWGELWGIADRTDFDLKAHMAESKADTSYFDPVNNKKYIPYVIEPSVGLNRLFLTCLADSYVTEGEGENARTYLKLDPKVAPIKVGILPVVKKISDIAKPIFTQLSEDFVCEYDDVGTIGKRYARFDEIGTPFCVTIDSANYEAGKVTVRYRDSMEQELVDISELNEFLRKKMK